MNTNRNPRSNIEAETLREAVINYAYGANVPNSVVEGLRHASELWLLARRGQPLDDIMRDVKRQKSDPDIARITNDLRHAPEAVQESRSALPKVAQVFETNWTMV